MFSKAVELAYTNVTNRTQKRRSFYASRCAWLLCMKKEVSCQVPKSRRLFKIAYFVG